MKQWIVLIALSFFTALIDVAVVFAEDRQTEVMSAEPATADDSKDKLEEDDRSIGYRMLIYLPNRVLDLLDIVRLRGRIGPGIGVGVRATKVARVDLSSYATLYAGLPGPRQEPTIKLPVGVEMYSGLGVSLLGIETDGAGPHYSPTEIGLDAQLLLIGGSLTIDPLEILDFVTGFVGIEIVKDDL